MDLGIPDIFPKFTKFLTIPDIQDIPDRMDNMLLLAKKEASQPAITCSKLTIETLE